MATNLALDDKLIILAQKLRKHRSKKEAVTEALRNYVQYLKQFEIINFFGQIDFSSDYDYKKQRNK